MVHPSRAKAALLVLTMCVGLSAAGAAELPFSPFTARYKVSGYGLPVGKSVLALEDAGDGLYRMRSEVYPEGLAALLVSDRIEEQASGAFLDGSARPTHYRQRRTRGDENQLVEARFDWESGRVHARDGDEQAVLDLDVGVVDPLSLHLQVMWDLRHGTTRDAYRLVDETEIKTYAVQGPVEERIETPAGTLSTLRISRGSPGSTRITRLWFAPSLDYLVVQISQEKKGKEILRMELESVSGLGR